MPPSLIKEATIRFNEPPKMSTSNENFALTSTMSFADDRVETSEYDPVLFVKDGGVTSKEKLSDSRLQLNFKNANTNSNAIVAQGRDSGRIIPPTTRGGGGSQSQSPMVSGRPTATMISSARPSARSNQPSARSSRAAAELQAEIRSVRDLQ